MLSDDIPIISKSTMISLKTARVNVIRPDGESLATASSDAVSLIGWNGKRNVGDDAMTAVIINYVLKNFSQQVRFRLLADDACLAHYVADESHIDANCAADSIKGFAGYNTFQQIPYVRRWLNPLLFDNRLAKSSPVLLVGGGSIFHSVFRSQRLAKVVTATRLFHSDTLIGAIGVSLGPFKTEAEKYACQQVLRQLDFVAVRDQRSWDVLQQLDVGIPAVRAMDIALLLPELLPAGETVSEPKPLKGPSVGIALRQGHTPDAMMTALATSLNALQSANDAVVVNLLNFSDVDEAASAQLQQRLEAKERVRLLPYSDRPQSMYQQLSECSLVLASRLHAAVISYAVGTPFGVLSYHQKCVDFAQEVGLDDDWVMPIQSLSAETLTARLMTAIEAGEPPAVQMPVEQAKATARTSFQFLETLRPVEVAV